MAESLKLLTNVPEVISLAFADGLPTSSQFSGDQVMFSLMDGRKWYVAPFVAKKLEAAGIQAREPFSVCKREVTDGNRRTVQYEVAKLPAASAAAPAAAAVVPHHGSNPSQEVTPLDVAAKMLGGGARVPAPIAAATVVESSVVNAMVSAGFQAIDAVLEVEEYARRRGMTDFAFGADNIQKIMVSLYIDNRKGGRA